MEMKVVREYIESIISSWDYSNVRDRHNPEYRQIWISENDVIALKEAHKLVKKEIEKEAK